MLHDWGKAGITFEKPKNSCSVLISASLFFLQLLSVDNLVSSPCFFTSLSLDKNVSRVNRKQLL